MKKFISTASALAMAVSAVMPVVPFAAGAADANKTYEMRAFVDKDGKAVSTTISADAIAKGDVIIPVGVYYKEGTKDTQGIRAQWTVNSTDGDASNKNVTFNQCEPGSNYYNSPQTVKWDGKDWQTDQIIGFAGSLGENRKGVYFSHPSPDTAVFSVDTKQDSSQCKNAFGSAVWTPKADGSYDYMGSNSDDYPLTVFEVVFAKGTPAGTYTLDFIDYADDPAAPKNSTCQVETAAGTYTKGNGKLKLNSLSIEIQGEKTGTSTTQPTDGPSNSSEFVISGKNYTLAPGEKKEIEFTVQSGGHKVVLTQCEPDIPAELSPVHNDKTAYCVNHNVQYTALGDKQWTATFKDPKTADAVSLIDGESIMQFDITVPTTAKPGTKYTYGMKFYHVVEDSFKPIEFDCKIVPGTITVADDNTPSSDDFVITAGNYEINAGESVEACFKVQSGGHKVILAQCELDIPDELRYSFDDRTVYCVDHTVQYTPLGHQWTATFKDPKTSDAVSLIDGEDILVLKISAPADAKAGTYKYGLKMYHVVEDAFKPTEFDAKVVYGTIKVKSGTASEVMLGDANESHSVDSTDASRILQEYAALSTGGKGTFNAYQKEAADVNGDGAINSADASLVLQFYAYRSTGGKLEDMRDWLRDVKK